MTDSTTVTSNHVDADGLNIHYLEAGTGDTVLMLHGWPTSAHLWRDIVPVIGENNRAIAMDLPGYGRSDKPLDVRYSFSFFRGALDNFLDALEIDAVHLVVHDLGGPVGLNWGIRNPDRVRSITLMNTLAYPEMSWAVKLFGLALVTPGMRYWLAGDSGQRFAMRLGVTNKQNITPEVMAGYTEPFATKDAKTGLIKGALGLGGKGFTEIAEGLKNVQVPVRIIYGKNDRILPDVAQTMRRVQEDVPGEVEITELENCGHFLQEDNPEEIAALLKAFVDSVG